MCSLLFLVVENSIVFKVTYFYFFSTHTLFNLFCTILTNPSMVNLTLVTYLLIELLTDTALSHVLFVLHVPTGIRSNFGVIL
jgi:hypothetical protein